MSTGQSNAAFEKWWGEHHCDVQTALGAVLKQIAHQAYDDAWAKSRAALVVELPHDVTHVTNKEYESGRDDVISAVRSAGITVRMSDMTKESFTKRMLDIAKGDYGAESAHADADDLMVEYLREHGLSEAMDAFEAMTKWYA
ncbi:hypothetical protein [Pectobacterium parmentieri]|uniref:hypothetical protein n=1 Tax=Pectobacterium parmentieri TaxID=1905730 RepID=UPI000F8ECF9E|nr:hypothetical protein [Pectobacterium parmentieri]AZS56763.1 hypothetical protein C5E18_11835 [Pectobacterium parmentieri]MBI0431670.1 hypothetical protein [Pectobacterium parmentieri]